MRPNPKTGVFVREDHEPLYFDIYSGTLRFSVQNFVRKADCSRILLNPICVSELEDQVPLLL